MESVKICKLSDGEAPRVRNRSKKIFIISEKSCEKQLTTKTEYDKISRLSGTEQQEIGRTEAKQKNPKKSEKSCEKCLTFITEICYNDRASPRKRAAPNCCSGNAD